MFNTTVTHIVCARRYEYEKYCVYFSFLFAFLKTQHDYETRLCLKTLG